MDKENTINFLVDEKKYPKNAAEIVAEKLVQAAPEIQKAFVEYKEGNVKPMMMVEDYSIDILMEQHGMNEIAALLTLDWLLREPEKAKASLKKGHDSIKIRRKK